MTRKKAPVQINAFVGGLNTEGNYLNENPNTSFDELNMELLRDKSRRKRFGFDYESNHVNVATHGSATGKQNYSSVFIWENAGGDPNKSLVVACFGNNTYGFRLSVFDPDGAGALSNNKLADIDLSFTAGYEYGRAADFAVIDGILVVVNGGANLYRVEYDGSSITYTTFGLEVRDFWGIQTFDDNGNDLLATNYITERPTGWTAGYTNLYYYNARNQTFALPRYDSDTDANIDPLYTFYHATGGFLSATYPSNCDSVIPYLYPDSGSSTNKTIERYWAKNAVSSQGGNTLAPRGFFIIDPLNRSASREAQFNLLNSQYTSAIGGFYLGSSVVLPDDKTPGGPTSVEQFSGRIWYGGFRGEVTGGDDQSPRLSSYIMFSRTVKKKTDIGRCYQTADPTSNIDSAIADDDGGYIKIDDAYNIVALKSAGGYLYVFAENGVWRVGGTTSTPFSATNYDVAKLSDHGCVAPCSIVFASANNFTQYGGEEQHFSIFYWSHTTIQAMIPGTYGSWTIKDLTTDSINTFYNDIADGDKSLCVGYFEPIQRRVHWWYNSNLVTKTGNDELVYSVDFNAFTPMQVAYTSGTTPYITSAIYDESANRTIHLVVDTAYPTTTYSFGEFSTSSSYDWVSTGTNVDYDAYILTAIITGGDPRARKQVPYLWLFFAQNGTNSACQLNTQWNWTTNVDYHKWSTPREVYKYNSTYDNSSLVVYSKNKIRGLGKALGFKLTAEAGKTLQIWGWSFDLTASNEE